MNFWRLNYIMDFHLVKYNLKIYTSLIYNMVIKLLS